jgi:hypothetical protein
MVNASSKGDMATRDFTIQNDVVRILKCRRIAVGRSPHQENGCALGDGNASEVGVMLRGA